MVKLSQIESPWRTFFKVLVVVALFGWLLNYANVTFLEVFQNLTLASPAIIFASLFFFLIHIVLVYFAWHRSLSLFHIDIAARESISFFAFSTLTKYLPSGVWHAGSRVYMLGSRGYSKISAFYSVLYESVLSITITAALVSLLYAVIDREVFPLFYINLHGYIFFCIGVVLLLSLCIPTAYRLVFRRYASRLESDLPNFTVRALSELLLLCILSLVVFVLGYYFCFKAYLLEQFVLTTEFSFVVLAATLSGFLVIFSPAGLGVRESMLYVLATQFLDDPLLVTICLAPRFILLLSEVLFFCLVRFFTASRSM